MDGIGDAKNASIAGILEIGPASTAASSQTRCGHSHHGRCIDIGSSALLSTRGANITPKPTRAALYVRASTPNRAARNQAAFEQNPEVQEQPLRQMAEQGGWSVVKVYSDRMSGAAEDRPGLKALMQDGWSTHSSTAPRAAHRLVGHAWYSAGPAWWRCFHLPQEDVPGDRSDCGNRRRRVGTRRSIRLISG